MPTAYGLLSAAGCVAGVLWLKRHREGLDLSENEFWAAMWTLLAGGLIGAKLLFVVLGWQHYARGELRLFADFHTGFVFLPYFFMLDRALVMIDARPSGLPVIS